MGEMKAMTKLTKLGAAHQAVSPTRRGFLLGAAGLASSALAAPALAAIAEFDPAARAAILAPQIGRAHV